MPTPYYHQEWFETTSAGDAWASRDLWANPSFANNSLSIPKQFYICYESQFLHLSME